MSCTRSAACLLPLLAGSAFAQDSDSAWMLSLSALRDENAYEHAVASVHVGFGEDTWLSLLAGSSQAPSTETDVRAKLLAADIEHDFGPAGFALGIQSWGDANNLETQDVRGELFFSRERYRFGLILERRDIDIYFTGIGAPRLSDLRRIGVEADGIGLSGRFRVAPDWQVYGTWMDYDYPARMRLVPRADRLNLLSTSTVTLAYSFVDHYTTLGVEKAFDRILLNVDVSRDRSTVDQSELQSVSASVLLPVAKRLDLEFTLGSSRLAGATSAGYGGVTLFYYGGG